MTRFRISISVPPDAKARMDKFDPVNSVNWSTIAVGAFEQHMAETLKRKGTTTMNEGLERLRASKGKLGVTEFWKGRQAGEAWALRQAEASELANIAEWKASFPGGEWGGIWEDGDNGRIYADIFARKVDRENIIRPDDAQAWWDEMGYPNMPPAEFVHGFADGAVDVWKKV
jgi:hypothetical protein